MLTLDSNVLSIEVPTFYKFGELFGYRGLGRDRVGGNHLDAAELCPLGCSVITIEYLYVSFLHVCQN